MKNKHGLIEKFFKIKNKITRFYIKFQLGSQQSRRLLKKNSFHFLQPNLAKLSSYGWLALSLHQNIYLFPFFFYINTHTHTSNHTPKHPKFQRLETNDNMHKWFQLNTYPTTNFNLRRKWTQQCIFFKQWEKFTPRHPRDRVGCPLRPGENRGSREWGTVAGGDLALDPKPGKRLTRSCATGTGT